MADINQIVSLGIGTPAGIKFFLTFGLGISTALTAADVTVQIRADDAVICASADDVSPQLKTDAIVFRVTP